MGIFDALKGFDKDKTKVQLKCSVTRLKLHMKKNHQNVKIMRREIANLLQSGKEELARIKAEQVIREEHIIQACEILEQFLELLGARFLMIETGNECPPDIKEAVCTVIWAATRCQVPELMEVTNQFKKKYGKEWVESVYEAYMPKEVRNIHQLEDLLPPMDPLGSPKNCVNRRVMFKFSYLMPDPSEVYEKLQEIAAEYEVDYVAPPPVPMAGVPPPAYSTSSFPSTVGDGSFVPPVPPPASDVGMSDAGFSTFPSEAHFPASPATPDGHAGAHTMPSPGQPFTGSPAPHPPQPWEAHPHPSSQPPVYPPSSQANSIPPVPPPASVFSADSVQGGISQSGCGSGTVFPQPPQSSPQSPGLPRMDELEARFAALKKP